MPTITIDSTWLANAANGNATGGWSLATANTTYQLAIDVVASRTAFVFGAPGVTLDLNGHTITYNNEGTIAVTNGDFSADAIGVTSPTGGWNVTGVTGGATCQVADAASWHMVPNGQSTAHVLQVVWNPDTAQPDPYIIYGPITVPSTDRIYTVGILASNLDTTLDAPPGRACTVDLEVYNDSGLTTQPTVRKSYAGNGGFGEGSWFSFYPNAGTTSVYVKVTLTHGSGSGAITAALSQLVITRSSDFGVCATNASADSLSDENIFTTQNTIGGRQGYPTAIANWSGPCGDNWQLYTGGGVITDSTCATGTAAISGGVVTGVTITGGGSGYTTAPKVIFSNNGSPSGRAATGTATISGGVVTAVTITDGGSGYDQAPLVTFESVGAIVQGGSKGHFCTPIFALNASGSLTVRNVVLKVNGPDTQGIDASTGSAVAADTRTIDRVTMYFATVPWITNRQALYCAINTVNTSTATITGCVVYDSPQAGIKAGTTLVNGSTGVAYTTAISGNSQWPNELITNGYGLYPAGSQVTVDHNSIITTATKGGRGLIIQVASNSVVYDTINVYQNRCDIYEAKNREAGGTNGSRGMELRNLSTNGGAVKNVTIDHNTFIAHASTATQKYAYGGRIPLNVPATNPSVQDAANISITNNMFRGIMENAISGGMAFGLLIDESDAGIGLIYSNNTYESNYTSLQLGGSNAIGGSAVADSTFTSETLLKSALGDQTQTYTSIGIGYASQTVSNVKWIDFRYSGGATNAWAWGGTGTKTVDEGWLLTEHAQDGLSNPVAGVGVVVTDAATTSVHTGTTGSSGNDGPFAVVNTTWSGVSSGTATAHGPHTITYTAPTGYNTPSPHTLTVSSTQTDTVTLTSTGGSAATALTLSGPTSGTVSQASTNFTVALSPSGGTVSGTLVVTPTASPNTGTFAPTSVNLTTASPSATFTFTPSAAGTYAIGVTNNGSLTDPATLSYVASASVGGLGASGSYLRYQTAVFGTSKAGLATVGYALYNADGSPNGTRQTVGVQDLHDGSYGALVTFPDAFQGRITWDTGETTPVYASENINDYRLDLSQNVPARDVSADTTQTTGDCLSTSRADAAGNMTLDLANKTQTIYGPDGTTVVRIFHVDNVDTPTERT